MNRAEIDESFNLKPNTSFNYVFAAKFVRFKNNKLLKENKKFIDKIIEMKIENLLVIWVIKLLKKLLKIEIKIGQLP